MHASNDFEQRLEQSLSELERECHPIVSRFRSLVQVVETEEPMGGRTRTLRTILRNLEEAIGALGVQTGRVSVSLAPSSSEARGSRAVARCVSNLLSDIDGPAPAGGAGRERDNSGELRGSSRVVPVPQVLDLLALTGRTGMLEVSGLHETFRLVIEGGDVVSAVSDNSPTGLRLGEILVSQGAVQHAVLARLVRRVSSGGKKLGEVICAEGVVTEQQLRAALELQIRALFQRLHDCEECAYVFRQGPHAAQEVRARLSIRALLLESALRSGLGAA